MNKKPQTFNFSFNLPGSTKVLRIENVPDLRAAEWEYLKQVGRWPGPSLWVSRYVSKD